MEESSNVRVGVRVRPLLPREVAESARQCLSHPHHDSVMIGKDNGHNEPKVFTYDYMFPSTSSQEDVYENCVMPLVDASFEGYNCTILAYGQTGSGKTYTMGNMNVSADDAAEDRGIIPRFVADVFRRLEAEKDFRTYSCKVSLLEIYNDDIIDLLDSSPAAGRWSSSTSGRGGPSVKPPSLQIREDVHGVAVVGLKEVEVSGVHDVLNALRVGAFNRTTASTSMNDESSRSHAVFTLSVECTPIPGVDPAAPDAESGDAVVGFSDEMAGKVASKLTFVDLAGSERLKRTQAEGARMKEGIHINVGLLALGNVINALGDEERRQKGVKVHVPYRDSKLTRLLQDGLGGNSRTLFLACVSPADTSVDETLNTLRYAYRARNIRNKPTKNVDQSLLQAVQLRRTVLALQAELAREHFKNASADGHDSSGGVGGVPIITATDDAAVLQLPHVQRYIESTMSRVAAQLSVPAHALLLDSPVFAARATAHPTVPLSALPPLAPASTTDGGRSRRSVGGAGSASQHTAITTSNSSSTAPANGASGQLYTAGKVREDPDSRPLPTTLRKLGLSPSAMSRALAQLSAEDEMPVSASATMSLVDGSTGDEGGDDAHDIEVLEQLLYVENAETAFDSAKKEEDEKLRDFDEQISTKELLLEKLQSSLKYFQGIQAKYEETVEELRKTEEEKAELERRMKEAVSKRAVDGASSGHPDHARLIALQETIRRLNEQLVEHKRLASMAAAQTARADRLNGEINKLKEAKVRLQKQQTAAAARHREMMELKQREIEALKKSKRTQDKTVLSLQNEGKKQAQQLLRRHQALEATRRQLRSTEAQLLQVLQFQRQRDAAARSSQSKSRLRSSSPRDAGVLTVETVLAPAVANHAAKRSSKGGTAATPERSQSPPRPASKTDPAKVFDAVQSAKALLDAEIAGRVRAVQAEQMLATNLSKRADLLRQLSDCMEIREDLLAQHRERSGAEAAAPDADNDESEENNDRDIESLEMRLSLTDQNIEEAMAELGLSDLSGSSSSTARPTPEKATPRVGSLARLDGAIKELSGDVAVGVLRLFVLEQAQILSREAMLKTARRQAELERDELKTEVTKYKHAVEKAKRSFASDLQREKSRYEGELISLLPEIARVSGITSVIDEEGGGDSDNDDAAASATEGTAAVVLPSPSATSAVPPVVDVPDYGKGSDSSLMSSALLSLQKRELDLASEVSRLTEQVTVTSTRLAAAEQACDTLRHELAAARAELSLAHAAGNAAGNDAAAAATASAAAEFWNDLGMAEEDRAAQIASIENATQERCCAVLGELAAARDQLRDRIANNQRVLQLLCTLLGDNHDRYTQLHGSLISQCSTTDDMIVEATQRLMQCITVVQDLYCKAKDLVSTLAIRDDQLSPAVKRLLSLGSSLMPNSTNFNSRHLMESPVMATKVPRPVGHGTAFGDAIQQAGLSLALVTTLPAGMFAEGAWKDCEDAVRGFVSLSAQRHVACEYLTSIVRLLFAELGLSPEDIDMLAMKVDVKKAIRIGRNLDVFMSLVCGLQSGSSSDSRHADNKTLEAVLLGVIGSSEGFSLAALKRVASDVTTSSVALSIDSFTLWHLQILAVYLSTLHKERRAMIQRRVELTLHLLRSCGGAADEYLETCVDSDGLFASYGKKNLSVVVGSWGTGTSAADKPDAKSAGAVDIATRLRAKVERMTQRFQARCKACSPVDVAQLRYCDTALKLLYGVIRRVSGAVLFRMQELLRQLVFDEKVKREFWENLRRASSETAHALVDWAVGSGGDPGEAIEAELFQFATAVTHLHQLEQEDFSSGTAQPKSSPPSPPPQTGALSSSEMEEVVTVALSGLGLWEGGTPSPMGPVAQVAARSALTGIVSGPPPLPPDGLADVTSFGLELYTALCESDESCCDSWLYRGFAGLEEGRLRRGNVHQEAYHPLKDLFVDDLVVDSDTEQELYDRADAQGITEGGAVSAGAVTSGAPRSSSPSPQASRPDIAAAVSIRLHDGSVRFGGGLAWIVCKQAIALDGITLLLCQLCELGLIRLPVMQALQDVVVLEKRLAEMSGTVDGGTESFVLTGMTSQYVDALNELAVKVQEWEASHGVVFTQKGKSLLACVHACLQAVPVTASRGLADLLTLPSGPATSSGDTTNTHRMSLGDDLDWPSSGPYLRQPVNTVSALTQSQRHFHLRRPSPTTKVITSTKRQTLASPLTPSVSTATATPVASTTTSVNSGQFFASPVATASVGSATRAAAPSPALYGSIVTRRSTVAGKTAAVASAPSTGAAAGMPSAVPRRASLGMNSVAKRMTGAKE